MVTVLRASLVRQVQGKTCHEFSEHVAQEIPTGTTQQRNVLFL